MTVTKTTIPSASRVPPPEVSPVVVDGVRYQQVSGDRATDGQVGGMLAAYNPDGSLRWRLKIYENRRRADLEEDVQDIYFSSLQVEPDHRLRVVNEAGRAFIVDVKTRTVTAEPAKPVNDDLDVLRVPPR